MAWLCGVHTLYPLSYPLIFAKYPIVKRIIHPRHSLLFCFVLFTLERISQQTTNNKKQKYELRKRKTQINISSIPVLIYLFYSSLCPDSGETFWIHGYGIKGVVLHDLQFHKRDGYNFQNTSFLGPFRANHPVIPNDVMR